MHLFVQIRSWILKNNQFILGTAWILLALICFFTMGHEYKWLLVLAMGILYLAYGFYLRRRTNS